MGLSYCPALGAWQAGGMERVTDKSPVVLCSVLCPFGVQGKKKGLPFFFRGGNWLYWAVLDPSAGRAVVTLHISRGSLGLRGAWGWVEGVGKGMGTSVR